jgi:peptidoglycan hydrolase FlgJ
VNDKQAGFAINTPQVYTDLNSLNRIRAQSQTDKAAAMRSIAQQFEQMMLQQMMKSMRQANESFGEGDITSSSEEKFYRDMFDNQLSLSMSQGRGFGMAEALLRQFRGKYATGPEGGAAAGAAAQAGPTTSLQNVARRQALQALTNTPGVEATPEFAEAMYQLFQGGGETQERSTAPVDASAIDGTPDAFVKTLLPVAERIAQQLGVDSRILLSQAALETGWGQKVLQRGNGASSFNFFNIKAGADWQGATVTVPTIEYRNGVAVREVATFRAYASPEESFSDYANLIAENPRYQQALARGGNPAAYIRALAAAGYATDPQYADKILSIFSSDQLDVAQQSVIYSDASDLFSDTRRL